MTARKTTSELDSGQIRQGDVLLVRTNLTATDAKEVTTDKDRVVLRHGEATGHAHAFYERKRVTLRETSKKERHLTVVETALLKHEEHTHAKVIPGTYDLPVQTEWTDDNEPRAVED
jgi:hypothetical protein